MTEKGSRDRLTVYLKGLGPSLRKRCEDTGIERSQYVLDLIAKSLEQDLPVPAHKVKVGERVELRTTVSALSHERIKEALRGSGFRTLSKLVEAAVCQGSLGEGAVKGPIPEATAVQSRSNIELRAIGRNINQIAHSLNLYPGKVTTNERQVLAALPEQIAQHILLVSKTLAAIKPPARPERERTPRKKAVTT